MFSLVVDDVTHAWFASVKDDIADQDLKVEFLKEFREEAEKIWDEQKMLQGLTQGKASAKEFVRTVKNTDVLALRLMENLKMNIEK